MRKKNYLKIFGLVIVIIASSAGIVLIGRELNSTDKKTSSVGVLKTKAAEKTYAKNIAFAPTNTPVPVEKTSGFSGSTPTATSIPLATATSIPNPSQTRLLAQAPSLTPTEVTTSPTDTIGLSPSPTEIIVALNRTGSVSPTNASSPVPTKVNSLPDAGYLTYSIGFFLIAGLAIGLAFLL